MSSRDAQKSEIHNTTDDASTSPASARRTPAKQDAAASRDDQQNPKTQADRTASPASNFERGAADADIDRNPIAGAGDTTVAPDSNKAKDRAAKTFPEDVTVKRDESDVGGPIDIDLRE